MQRLLAQALQATKAAELHGRPLAPPRDEVATPPRAVLARHHALAIAKAKERSAEAG